MEKTLKIEGRRRGRRDEMVEWYHQLNRHEFEQTPGNIEGQGSLACCSPWGRKEMDTITTTAIQGNLTKIKALS